MLDRRRFLRLPLGMVPLGAAGAGMLAAMPAPAGASLRVFLLGLSPDHVTARRLGRAYLASLAGTTALATTLRRLAAHRPHDTDALRGVMAQATREDLARGDTVLVDGWVLARTEAAALGLIGLC